MQRRRTDRKDEPRTPPNAVDAALRLLGSRTHGEVELRRKLRQRGCPADEIDRAIVRMRELGYLDDEAFAQAVVAYRARSRGAQAIAAELAAKGVSRDVAAAAVAGVDRETAVAAARAIAARSRGVEPRLLATRLMRRGFDRDVIKAALDVTEEEE